MNRAATIVSLLLDSEDLSPESVDVGQAEELRQDIEDVEQAIEDAVEEFNMEAEIGDIEHASQAKDLADEIITRYSIRHEMEAEDEQNLRDAVMDAAYNWGSPEEWEFV